MRRPLVAAGRGDVWHGSSTYAADSSTCNLEYKELTAYFDKQVRCLKNVALVEAYRVSV